MEPRISLCMIVRNEEANLPRVLGSIEGLVDEKIIVDTGSTDRTIEAARALGAKVGHFAWCDDFAAARNHSLSLATGDWILVLDADDEFAREDIPAAREIVRATDADGICVRQTISCPGTPPWDKHQLAFLRNRLGLRYQFRVHERVVLDPGRILRSPLRIAHRGYTMDLLPEKRVRNRRILELMKGDPDPEARVAAGFYLGRLHSGERRFEEAFQEYKAAAYSGLASGYRLYAVFGLAQLCATAGDRKMAEGLYRSLLQANPGAVEAELGLAELCLEQGRAEEARDHFETARRSDLRIFAYEREPWEERARARLAAALEPTSPTPPGKGLTDFVSFFSQVFPVKFR